MNLPFLAQRLFNTPLAIAPGKLEVVMAALAGRMGLAPMTDVDWGEEEEARDVGYDVVQRVAVVPIEGTLVQRSGYLRPYSGMTGYDGIRANYAAALADASVTAIALDIRSQGGEVAGCFDLVDDIYRARGAKPTWAILSECAYSAAFAIATAADRVIVPRTGGTGSVGVVLAQVDLSKAYSAAGMTVTLITYGDHKADGNEFSPLDKAVKARFQKEVDVLGELFCDTVARNLGISVKSVRDTQAATFMGAAGVEVGFAHEVMSPDAAFRKLLSEIA